MTHSAERYPEAQVGAWRALPMPNPSSPAQGTPAIQEVCHDGVVVVIGPNGSGKSRFGAWLEAPAGAGIPMMTTHPADLRALRLSAQRVLLAPDQVQRSTVGNARQRLDSGGSFPGGAFHGTSRVQGDPIAGQLNDYAALVETLFAERDAQASRFFDAALSRVPDAFAPASILDRVKELWEIVLPKRRLVIDHENNAISAAGRENSTTYPISVMSDGERVALYLIAHTLLAAPDRILIVDEPELHLHETLQVELWDALETARRDLTFVYITHDLDFAASRTGSPKIIMREYTQPAAAPQHWDWDVLPPSNAVPEDVLLRIAGARRPTLFVEGQRGSIDQEVYEALYADWHIEPVGSCQTVIAATSAFRQTKFLHRYIVAGIIDGDDRDDSERNGLAASLIYVLPVACIENLLLVPEALAAVGVGLGYEATKITQCMEDVSRRLLRSLGARRDATVASRTRAGIVRRLGRLPNTGGALANIAADVQATVLSADIPVIYQEAADLVKCALVATTHSELLVFDRNKGLLPEAAQAFFVTVDVFRSVFRKQLRESDKLRNELRRRLDEGGVTLGKTIGI